MPYIPTFEMYDAGITMKDDPRIAFDTAMMQQMQRMIEDRDKQIERLRAEIEELGDANGVEPMIPVVEVIPVKVWIERDFFGDMRVVRKYADSEPVVFATYHYVYGHSDNSSTRSMAVELAKRIGAADPVEEKSMQVPNQALPDCRTCCWSDSSVYNGAHVCRVRSPIVCINGDAYVSADPVRLYEKEGE